MKQGTREKFDQSAAIVEMSVESSSPMPLYHQVYLVLRERILTSIYPFESLLPSEKALCEEFDVSRITMQRALNELAESGLVDRRRGRGTQVCQQVATAAPKPNFDGLIENLLTVGARTQIDLLDFRIVPADPAVAQALNLAVDEPVQFVVRRRRLEGEPFSYVVSHVPEKLASGITRKDLRNTPLLALLEQRGIRLSSVRQTITSVASDPETSKPLGVDLGTPLTRITRIVRDQTDRPVERIIAHYRPDKFAVEQVLTRVNRNADEALWK